AARRCRDRMAARGAGAAAGNAGERVLNAQSANARLDISEQRSVRGWIRPAQRQPDGRTRHTLRGVPYGFESRGAQPFRLRTERGGVASPVISLLGLDLLGIVH